ncbi:zinc finger protein 233-like isoform X3 [Bombyx mandarina]|uniref:Zinc finger protein 233-like isoform X3 n=1 Tax=Bombyx mandarina TaxID=7092 RepID=A0A6J2JI79_BOMMA|nr:zinc finger protein 233-like isoform X3 [Bombyx mandarina]
MSEVVCKLEDDLCRCCHSEGAYKNLTGVYNFGGIEEIYYDMLRDTFDINLNPMPGLLCVSTYTICDACIEKLRDATNFKKQVLFYEDKFKEMISKNLIRGAESDDVLEIKQEETDEVFSRIPGNRVKVKKRSVSTALSDHNDDDDWHCDDELLDEDHKGQSEVPKKKSKRAQSKTKGRSKKDLNKKKKIKMESSAENKDNAEGHNEIPRYYTIVRNDYTCNVCHRTYASQPLVSQHYRFVHLKRRPKNRKCPHCDQRIPGHLRAYHLADAHGIPAPTCGICGKRYRYNCHLVQHQKKVHMGEKSAVCGVCDKGFFNDVSLKLHMMTHSDERKHECGHCGRRFRWESNLKDHVKIHTGDKSHVCRICEKGFIQKSTLKQHLTRVHNEIGAV